jgi:phage tail tape measure protein, TP901 family, core region
MAIPISTRFEIQGEKEFTNAVKQINAEYKVLQSELKLTESSFIGQQNSMAALTAKSTEYDSMLAKLQTRLKEQQSGYGYITEALEKWKQRLSDLTYKTAPELNITVDQHIERFREAIAAVDYLTTRQLTWQTSVNDTKSQINNLNAEINTHNTYLKEAQDSTDGTATSIDIYGNAVKTAVPEQRNLNDSLEGLARVLIAAGIQKGFNELVDLLKSTVNASIDFESAITGVFKTVEGTPEQLQRITDGIKQLSTEIPLTASELAGIAESAGQL